MKIIKLSPNYVVRGENNMKLKILMRKALRKIRGGSPSIEELRAGGVVIGKNCHIYGSIDSGHKFLVTIGDNVTLATTSRILTHDGSTFKMVGYSRVGRVDIGNDVFVGAGAIILPNVKIGNRVVVGAGSVVTHDVPDNSIVAGNPAKVIASYDDYEKKIKEQMETKPVWNTHYSKKTEAEKLEMKEALKESGYGFDI